jgi:hypothetical protein
MKSYMLAVSPAGTEQITEAHVFSAVNRAEAEKKAEREAKKLRKRASTTEDSLLLLQYIKEYSLD